MVCGHLKGGRSVGTRGMRSEDLYMVLCPSGLAIRPKFIERERLTI
jgi:hypothetical protein